MMTTEHLSAAAAHLHTARSPRVGIILGSGLGGLVHDMDQPQVWDYRDVPGMAVPTVAGHTGRFYQGRLGGVDVLAAAGRFHLYEGHDAATVVTPVQIMAATGIRTLIVSNAAGAVDPCLSPGDIMVLQDHLNLTGADPLRGPHLTGARSPFLPMADAYDAGLAQQAVAVGQHQGLPIRTGVYAGLAGPSYETAAEVRMLATFGAHAVGMSTVLEVIMARYLDLQVLGMSVITNMATGVSPAPHDHSSVLRAAGDASAAMRALVTGVLTDL